LSFPLEDMDHTHTLLCDTDYFSCNAYLILFVIGLYIFILTAGLSLYCSVLVFVHLLYGKVLLDFVERCPISGLR